LCDIPVKGFSKILSWCSYLFRKIASRGDEWVGITPNHTQCYGTVDFMETPFVVVGFGDVDPLIGRRVFSVDTIGEKDKFSKHNYFSNMTLLINDLMLP
jgi:hypothetical protein